MAMLDIFGSGMLNAAEEMIRKKKATDGRTNLNAQPAKKGKTAKSKKRRGRESDAALQQQMQADQFKFLQDNIFDRTGATRRTMSGQIERDVPQGMDYFKNTGPDRPELVDRQNRLNNQGLKNPWFEANAREAVDLARRKQAEPPLFPGPQNQMTPEQQLRQGGNGVEVFDNPLFSQSNPRTGLNINTGPFVRSMDNPYGTARALFEPQVQQPAQQPAPGPVQSLFTPQPTMNRMDPPRAVYNNPAAPAQQSSSKPAQTNAPVNMFGVPDVSWDSLIPKWPGSSPMAGGMSNPFAGMFTDPTPQTKGSLSSDMSFGNDSFGPTTGVANPLAGVENPYAGGPSFMQRFSGIDPVTSSMIPDVMNMPEVSLPNMPWQRDKIPDPNDRTGLIEQPNWWDNLMSFLTPNPQDYQKPSTNSSPFQFAPML